MDRKYDKEEPSKLGVLNMTEAISNEPMGGTSGLYCISVIHCDMADIFLVPPIVLALEGLDLAYVNLLHLSL